MPARKQEAQKMTGKLCCPGVRTERGAITKKYYLFLIICDVVVVEELSTEHIWMFLTLIYFIPIKIQKCI